MAFIVSRKVEPFTVGRENWLGFGEGVLRQQCHLRGGHIYDGQVALPVGGEGVVNPFRIRRPAVVRTLKAGELSLHEDSLVLRLQIQKGQPLLGGDEREVPSVRGDLQSLT